MNTPTYRFPGWLRVGMALLMVLGVVRFGPPSAQAVEVVSGQDVTKQVWVANALSRSSLEQSFEQGFLMSALDAMYQQQPNLTPSGASIRLDYIRGRFAGDLSNRTAARAYDLAQRYKLSELVRPPYVLAATLTSDEVVELLDTRSSWEQLNDVLGSVAKVYNDLANEPTTDPLILSSWRSVLEQGTQWTLDQLLPSQSGIGIAIGPSIPGSGYQHNGVVYDFVSGTLASIWDKAKSNSRLGDAIDLSFSKDLGDISIQFDARKILGMIPDCGICDRVSSLLENDGSILKSKLGNLEALASEVFTKGQGAINEALGITSSLRSDFNGTLTKLPGFIADVQGVLSSAAKGIDLLASLGSLFSADLGRGIAAVGHAVLKIGQGLNTVMKFAQLGARLPAMIAAGPPGWIMAGVSVLSAVFDVAGLFGASSGPSVDDLILTEIGHLRDDVENVRQQMHERFDHIDAELNQLYETMVQGFNRLYDALNTVNGNIQRGFAAIQAQLNNIEGQLVIIDARLNYVVNLVTYQTERPSRKARETVIGRAALKNSTSMAFQEWDSLSVELQFGATSDAREIARADVGCEDTTLIQELAPNSSTDPTTNSVEKKVNYIAKCLQVTGFDTFWPQWNSGTNRLPDPGLWALSSEAYALLMTAWPQYLEGNARSTYEDRLRTITNAGGDLEQALKRITVTTSNQPNFGLFEQLRRNYDTAYQDLLKAAQDKPGELPPPALFNRLTAAKVLLSAVVQLGMSRSLSTDDALRAAIVDVDHGSSSSPPYQGLYQALLNGNDMQRILKADPNDMFVRVFLDATQTPSVNRTALVQALADAERKRLGDLASNLNRDLTNIASGASEYEYNSAVHTTLQLLNAVTQLRFGKAPTPSLCHRFTQTQQDVCGDFLTYWQQHGGLEQQGYPISGVLQEVSETDGKVYTVQYFERAVFEYHPEQPDPKYKVLLSLLGSFTYTRKYGTAGAPGQQASTAAGAQRFTQTGHTVGGVFLDYWKNHGGLAQQGYPLSEEFTEKSDIDGKLYTVQYFERAVFEYHPEQPDPKYKVLLSQLGTLRYRDKQSNLGR